MAQVPCTSASAEVNVTAPHASLAVGDENTGFAGQLIVTGPPTPLITGGVRSSVHVTVLDAVDVLPHASIAVKVLVCDLKQLPLTEPSLDVTVGVLQASVAVAVPNAPFISPADGLHPSDVVVPPDVSTGAVRSAIQVTVLDAVDVLPQ